MFKTRKTDPKLRLFFPFYVAIKQEIANHLVSDFLYSRWDYVNFHVVSICFGVESVFQLITEIINRNKFV